MTYHNGRPCPSPLMLHQRARALRAPASFGPAEMAGLGFSLKPPRFIRKLQPGKILKKIALPVAAIGAAFLIPGAAPLLAKGAVFAGKEAFKLGRGAFNIFKPMLKLPPSVPTTTTMPTNPQLQVFTPTQAGGAPFYDTNPQASQVPSGGAFGPPAPSDMSPSDATSAAPAAGASSLSPMVIGALALGAVLLLSRKR